MLKQQTSLSLSPYMQLYDALIPKDNFLRQMHDLVDFTFVSLVPNNRIKIHPNFFTLLSGKRNLIFSKENNLRLVAQLHPVISSETRKEETTFQFNKDVGMYVCSWASSNQKGHKTSEFNHSKPTTKIFFRCEEM
ncbi:hypothetical protein [Amphibacillus jilinensis]|uniref:hypothetical protein n=1 Tax=Amphibacillus jilinensis TaxID=1216008 RepID=UPI000A039678|nr:hypothetical protein [Amphibacillus jilinensis]